MFDLQTKLCSVPAAQGTIFTILDDLATPRALALQNLSDYVLTCQLEYSDDGGGTWHDLGVSFDIDPAGSGGSDLHVEKIVQSGRIRLLAAGGASANELAVALLRTSLSSSATFPLIVY